ncbi:MATE family efflux transporter [Roseisolibacter sp. H3M3-2]|uniref:MATE family efflux transporter n=1 Tax=Roseisolibacter sp. H3M3-2 TaxID=3031323 RepID=UPI0023DA340F|nr:MATE family efflux transporter [Roseisolibacter sp. H3M3-2]MDF1505263.1 MATE family efflux transporter [Roseisolibacter sp. H3M3-2]
MSSPTETLPLAPADAAPPPPGFWASVREALHGSQQDFTQGPLGRAILLLAVPMVLEMAMESVFAVTDIYFVSHIRDPRVATLAVAAVGLTESLLAAVYALAMGLAIGATAVVARRIGEKDAEGAAHAAAQAVLLGAAVAALLGVLGATFAPQLLRLMGASDDVLRVGVNFTRIMLGGEASIILLFIANAIFRGAGDAAIAMRTLWMANGINIVLGPLLIFGVGPLPELGVTGAAVGTTIGRATGAAYALWRLSRPQAAGTTAVRVRVAARHFRPDRAAMASLARLSWSGVLQTLIGTASWVGLVRIIASYGSEALAGYTIAIRLVVFAILPAWGMSNAAATLVGQALGAKDPERAERAVWRTAHYNAAFMGALGLLFVAAAGPLIGFFTDDPAVAPIAVRALRIIASGFLLYAYGMVLTAAFNGAGDTRTPTWLNFAVFWLFEIPVAWLLAGPLGWGPDGVFVAIAVAFSALAVASGVIFRRGRWKAQQV